MDKQPNTVKNIYLKYINIPIKYNDNSKSNIIIYLNNLLINWIDSKLDLHRIYDNYIILDKFKLFIYCEYMFENSIEYNYNIDFENKEISDYFEHFELTYSEEICDFYNYKEYCKSQNFDLFSKYNKTYNPLIYFIYSVCDYNEPYNDIEEEEETDNYNELIY